MAANMLQLGRRAVVEGLTEHHMAGHPGVWFSRDDLARIIRGELGEPETLSSRYHHGRQTTMQGVMARLESRGLVISRPHPLIGGGRQYKWNREET